MRRHGAEYESEILAAADDDNPEVIREVALALPNLPSPQATETLVKLFDRYDGGDRYLLETLHIASRGREEEMFRRVVDLPGAGVDPRLVNLVRILRPDDATEYLAAKLEATDVTPEARAALLEALGSVTTPAAGKSVAAVLTADGASSDVKRLALEALMQKLAGPWSGIKESPEVTAWIAGGTGRSTVAR